MTPCIGVVLGTRPEVIKLTPVIDQLRNAGWCRVALLPSGQHGNLLRQALAEYGSGELDVPPPSPATRDPAELVEILAERLRPSMVRLQPDLVLVQGDTATALAGATAASDLAMAIGHVEAGLRTYDLDHPFPEEFNRQAISRLARLHFAPTSTAAANLVHEGIPPASVIVTGNTIVDMLKRTNSDSSSEPNAWPIAVVTLHRRELAPYLNHVLAGLLGALEDHRNLRMIIPAHPNPAITEPLRAALGGHRRVEIVAPLSHSCFLDLLRNAAVAITDSGGVQEEAATLGVPLVIARRVTERPEVLLSGRAVVVGFDPTALRNGVGWALSLSPTDSHNGMLGDGRAAARIEQCLRCFLSPAEMSKRRCDRFRAPAASRQVPSITPYHCNCSSS